MRACKPYLPSQPTEGYTAGKVIPKAGLYATSSESEPSFPFSKENQSPLFFQTLRSDFDRMIRLSFLDLCLHLYLVMARNASFMTIRFERRYKNMFYDIQLHKEIHRVIIFVCNITLISTNLQKFSTLSNYI